MGGAGLGMWWVGVRGREAAQGSSWSGGGSESGPGGRDLEGSCGGGCGECQIRNLFGGRAVGICKHSV